MDDSFIDSTLQLRWKLTKEGFNNLILKLRGLFYFKSKGKVIKIYLFG